MSAKTVLTVGSLHYDVMVVADHLPQKDETVTGSHWYPKFGGKGGNQAVAAKLAGANSRMIGAVGEDAFGNFLREHLSAMGVQDQYIRTTPGTGSGISVAIQDRNGDYSATIVSGANLHIDSSLFHNKQIWTDVALLVLQNEIPEQVNLIAARAARSKGIRTVLNAAPFRKLSQEFSSLVDILVVNAVEAEMMGAGKVTSLRSAAEAAVRLSTDFKTVIVTAGSTGLAACGTNNFLLQLPAEKVAVISSHGAGDAFVGTLAAKLVANATVEQGCRDASLAAAAHVSKP
jgi:ribokinase